MLPMMEILRKREQIFNQFGIDDTIFIRPNSGAKTFTGQTVHLEFLDKEFQLFENYAGKSLDRIIAVISSPKVIDREWRCVASKGKIIAYSQYRSKNNLDIKRGISYNALKLAIKIAEEKWQPDKVYTIDICESNGKCSMLEINSFSCSGLYDSDMKKVVKEVSKIAVDEWEEYYN